MAQTGVRKQHTAGEDECQRRHKIEILPTVVKDPVGFSLRGWTVAPVCLPNSNLDTSRLAKLPLVFVWIWYFSRSVMFLCAVKLLPSFTPEVYFSGR